MRTLETQANTATMPEQAASSLFRKGFVAMLPLWAGAIPSGIAFGVVAHEAGIASVATVLMSLLVFSAAGQLSAVALIDEGVPWPLLLVTVLALNIQLLLLGVAVGRLLCLSRRQRLLTAWFLTDASFAIAAGRGPLHRQVLLGAGVSMYLGWNIGTWLGLVVGGALPDPRALGVSLVVPLSFLAVLMPLLSSRRMVAAALAAAAVTLPLAQVVPSGVAVLVGGVVGCAVGAVVARGAAAGQAAS